LITSLAKPLASLAVSDDNLAYLMEEELAAVLVRPLEEVIATLVREVIAGDEVDAALSYFGTKD